MPVVREGLPFILPPLGLAVLAAGFSAWLLALVAFVAALLMAGFFRDPERRVAGGPRSVVSPADGRLVRLETRDDGGVSLSIFLSPLDVHVNRAPVAARLVEAEHRPGRFLPAYRHEASEANEQTRLVFRGEAGLVRMRQVVGILARRIVLWKREGEEVERGERVGLMKFGSRVDLELEPPVRTLVRQGQRVRAAETVLAELGP